MHILISILSAIYFVLIASTTSFAGTTSKDIKIVFTEYVLLNEEFKASVEKNKSWGGWTYSELRAKNEDYYEKHFLPVLSKAEDCICKTGDVSLLMEYYGVLISSTNSASEAPSWTLGRIYLCKPDLVVSSYSKLGYYEQLIIYSELEFGFLNVTYKKEASIPNFNALKDKLTSLKPKQSPILNEVTIPDGWRLLTKDEVKGKWDINGFRYYYFVKEDFNGDGITDEARLLTRTDKSGFGLFVFLSNGNTYDIILLTNMDDMKYLNSMGINSVEPGTYENAFGKGYDGDYPKDEPKEITIKHHAIDFFKSESANSFFHWIDSAKKFRRTWISD